MGTTARTCCARSAPFTTRTSFAWATTFRRHAKVGMHAGPPHLNNEPHLHPRTPTPPHVGWTLRHNRLSVTLHSLRVLHTLHTVPCVWDAVGGCAHFGDVF